MKKLFLSALVAFTLFSACKKSDQSDENGGSSTFNSKSKLQAATGVGSDPATGVGASSSRGANFAKILKFMKSPSSGECIVVAHRGYWLEDNVPENSLLAIKRAVDVGVEAVELDIKMSKDNVPVIMHDYSLNRTTNQSSVFKGAEQVSQLNNGDIQKLQLKDRRGVLTGWHVPTLYQALDYIRGQKLKVLITLDIKDANALKACWKIVETKANADGVPARDWIVFKLNALVYGNNLARLESDLGLGKVADGSNTSRFKMMMVAGTNVVGTGLDYVDLFQQFNNKAYGYGVEILYKQDNGLLTNLLTAAKGKMVVGNFHCVPDAPNGRYWRDGGRSTYVLPDLFYNSKCCGRDTNDQRESDSWIFKNSQFVTTDSPVDVINHARNGGYRHLNWD